MTNLESRSVQSGTSARNLNDSRSTETATSRGTRLGTLEVPNSSPQEVRISVPLKSNTNINQTDKSHIESYQQSVSGSTVRNDEMRSDPDPAEQAEAYRDIIRENIGYEDLLQAHPDEQDMVDGIVELMLETVLCRNDYILIASSTYPAGMVRSRLLKLRYPHIDYVLFCLRKNTSKISTSDIHFACCMPCCAVIQKLGHAPCLNGTRARISRYPYLNAILSRVETPRGNIWGLAGSPDGTTSR